MDRSSGLVHTVVSGVQVQQVEHHAQAARRRAGIPEPKKPKGDKTPVHLRCFHSTAFYHMLSCAVYQIRREAEKEAR